MKSYKFLLALVLLAGYLSVAAQENTESVKKIKISDISILAGSFSSGAQKGSLSDFKTLAPGSNIPFEGGNRIYSSERASLLDNPFYSMLLGFQFSNKEKSNYKANPQLRLGLTYFSGSKLHGSFSESQTNPYDTLVSPKTGETVFIDSVSSNYSSISNKSQNLRLDLSILFRTNPQARVSLFTGIGLTAGISFNATTSGYNSKQSYSQMRLNQNNRSRSYSYYNKDFKSEYIVESYKNKNSFGFSAYIPLGIDFRIGNKNELLKNLHLFYELRPGLNITTIPELSYSYTSTSIQHGIGIKYSL